MDRFSGWTVCWPKWAPPASPARPCPEWAACAAAVAATSVWPDPQKLYGQDGDIACFCLVSNLECLPPCVGIWWGIVSRGSVRCGVLWGLLCSEVGTHKQSGWAVRGPWCGQTMCSAQVSHLYWTWEMCMCCSTGPLYTMRMMSVFSWPVWGRRVCWHPRGSFAVSQLWLS